MEKISLPFFYQLGAKLNPLTGMPVEASKRLDIAVASFNVQTGVRALLDLFPTLTVCRASGLELISSIDAIVEWLNGVKEGEWKKEDWSVDQKFRQVVNKAKEFETVLSAELQTLATYHSTQKAIYSTGSLIAGAENMFPESVKKKLPQQGVNDIRDGGKCLAFDIPTACGFHMMRAVEAVLHEYYVVSCEPQDTKKKLDNWGAYIAELNKSNDTDVKEVIAILQQIKDRHRNLIMHPEVVLSPDEASTLFEIAKGAIIAMAGKLPDVKKQEPKAQSQAKA